jgi:hypothetical protein
MKAIPAIVEAAQIDLDLAAEQCIVKLADVRDADTAAARFEQKGAAARETAALRRLEVGQILVRVRATIPATSGPKAKAWSEFLARIKLDDSTAHRWMDMAKTGKVHGKPASSPQGSSHVRGTGEAPSVTAAMAIIDQLAPSERATIQRSIRSSLASENVGDRDAYCTPDDVTAALPDVDLDPCSNLNSSVRAGTTYSIEAGQDGLALPWFGLVYVNFPFSDPLPWAEKLVEELPNVTGAGVMCNADHSPAWWHVLTKHLTIRLDFNERLQFKPPPGVEPSKNDRPQSLLMDAAFWAECDQPALLAIGTLWFQTGALFDVRLDAQPSPSALHLVRP